MRVRRKPEVIEAEQWFRGRDLKGYLGEYEISEHDLVRPGQVLGKIQGYDYSFLPHAQKYAIFVTEGEWIVTTKEKRWSMSDKEFRKNYEPEDGESDGSDTTLWNEISHLGEDADRGSR